ncbi:MAG: S-layer homology domain-containing protein [Clostridia bacterium]|nr:S-layer homology domain-containing protein [Clostridia bacterium]MDD6307906.1 S-layer homology domain-containing protein [Clostridia bacterium]
MKKIISLLLSILFITSVVIMSSAAETEMKNYVLNGGFEDKGTDQKPLMWTYSKTATIEQISMQDKEKHSGNAALMIGPGEGDHYVVNKFNAIGGKTYTFSAWVLAKKVDDRYNIKFEFYKKVDGSYAGNGSKSIKVKESNRWENIKENIEVPEGTEQVKIYLRGRDDVLFYWDDVSFLGETVKELDPLPLTISSAEAPIGENLLKNSSFEETDSSGFPAEWKAIGGSWKDNQYVTYLKDFGHSDNTSVRIQMSASGNPWIRQVVNVLPNTKYRISMWIRNENLVEISRGAVRLKYETHSENFQETGKSESETSLGLSTVSDGLTMKNEKQWTEVETFFTTPTGCRAISFYLRIFSSGIVWFDDISFCQVGETPVVSITTDSTFYYPSQKSGVAMAIFNEGGIATLREENVRVNFYLKDGDTVLSAQKDTEFFEGKAGFHFDTSLMTQMKHEYTMEAETVDLQGNKLGCSTTDVYVYPRPTTIDENCNYLNADGSVWIPTLGYHIPVDWWNDDNIAKVKELGINVVQVPYGYAYQYIKDPQTLNDIVAACGRNGVKALICMYYNMVPAAHDQNIESSRAVVNAFKDNDAVFGYAVQDEPFLCIPNAFEDGHKLLKKSYKMIRDIDDKHPVYLLEASTRDFVSVAKYCDVMAYDPYPSSAYRPGNCVRDYTEMAAQATRGLKPFYAVQQAFTYGGYYPTGDETRNFWYQGLLAENFGEGYFGVDKSLIPTDGSPNQPLLESPLGETITTFAKAEQDFALDVFKYGKYPVINSGLEKDYEYRSVLKDGEIYIVILNRHTEQDNRISKKAEFMNVEADNVQITAVIPATSTNGLVSLKDGKIKALYGCKDGELTVNGDTFIITLSSGQAAVFQISGVDTTRLFDARFTDIGDYSWAAEAIEGLSERHILKNCTGNSYEPGKAITRGEFAMYLIEALGICYHNDSDVMGKNAWPGFVDVAEDAYYWEALKAGKAAGVLKGIGDNFFAPDALVTRQDAMVIAARILAAVSKYYGNGKLADLKDFSDSAQIAEYAKGAVANMVMAGFIRGNADGTINPLGNMTRAEAAVMTSRIIGASTN